MLYGAYQIKLLRHNIDRYVLMLNDVVRALQMKIYIRHNLLAKEGKEVPTNSTQDERK